MTRIECLVEDRGEKRSDLRLLAITDCLDEKLAQRILPSNWQFAKHIEYLPTQRLSGLFELFQQFAVNIAFTGIVCNQIPKMADLGLANPVDAAKALLKPVGIPGQVVIDHQVRTLKVDTLASSIRGQKHLNVWVVLEGLLDLQPFFASDTAMDDDHRASFAQETW